MQIERVPIGLIREDPSNARLHSQRSIESIKNSLLRFGQQKPIVVDTNGVVRAGNGTLQAAQSLGWEEIVVVKTDLEGVELDAYAIADNRTSELAAWDNHALRETLKEVQSAEDEVLLESTGFDESAILALMSEDIPEMDSVDEEVITKEPKEKETKEKDTKTLTFVVSREEAEIVTMALGHIEEHGLAPEGWSGLGVLANIYCEQTNEVFVVNQS